MNVSRYVLIGTGSPSIRAVQPASHVSRIRIRSLAGAWVRKTDRPGSRWAETSVVPARLLAQAGEPSHVIQTPPVRSTRAKRPGGGGDAPTTALTHAASRRSRARCTPSHVIGLRLERLSDPFSNSGANHCRLRASSTES